MAASKAEEIYKQYIKPLLPAERLSLLKLIADDLVMQSTGPAERRKRDIMELHGLGKECWEGVDAKKYVSELRKEWERRL